MRLMRFMGPVGLGKRLSEPEKLREKRDKGLAGRKSIASAPENTAH